MRSSFSSHHIPLRLEQSPKTQPERLQYAKWLGHTNSLLMVFNNDLYLRQSPLFENDTRLTFTGKPDVIYNGIPDWLYQEDVLKNPEALWSSNDTTHILYATFNDSEVGLLNFPWFSTIPVLAGKSTHRTSFPSYRTVRYPTPGSSNPKVELYVLDITNITDLQRYIVTPPQALIGQSKNSSPHHRKTLIMIQCDTFLIC
ncbi:hypothetical protein HHI36_005026 [Cryptolaemus montrouzieri]|uniref:Dipeptidylpeptidase IV N-terminal domain-containing protein n=1 Tax=Cryptolaemus montrouzieri TaxID=559131 RepID=A0ABD2NSX8_9CUCU